MDSKIILCPEFDKDIVKYLYDKTCNLIIEKLTSENIIGKGFWGSVYKFDIKDHKVSIKIQPLFNDKTYDITIKDPRNIEIEIDILKKLSDYKIKNKFLHFPYYFWSTNCDQQSLIFYEYYSSNLKEFFYYPYTFNELKSIFYQAIISIYYYQQVTGYYHNDIHIENFLMNKINNNDKININYEFKTLNINKDLTIYKYYISIWDYANSVLITDTNKSNNIDIKQLKLMLDLFVKKYIDNFFDYNELDLFCLNSILSSEYKKYFDKTLKENKIKWNKISNLTIRSKKITKSVKKSTIYWILENNLFDQLLVSINKKQENSNIKIHLPNNKMLEWVRNLPSKISECIKLIE